LIFPDAAFDFLPAELRFQAKTSSQVRQNLKVFRSLKIPIGKIEIQTGIAADR